MVGLLFRHFYSCMDSYTLHKLYLTIVRPHLEYACEVWDPHLDKDIKLIEKVQDFASRVCLKQWNSSYSDTKHPITEGPLKMGKTQYLIQIVHNYGFADYPSPPLHVA